MQLKNKLIKHLRFELTPKEYSDFWYVASLLRKTKKKDVLITMMNKIKEILEHE